MDNMAEFARKLRARREELGLTQAQLAEKIGVSSQTISAYEKNSSGEKGKTPTLDKVVSLAKKLNVSIDYLCGLDSRDQECSMESLGDIAACLTKIASCVQCYGGVRIRKLTEEEYISVNCGIPDEFASETTSMAVFTIDNSTLANYFGTRNKVLELFNSGVIDKELYSTIIDGQLAKLQDYKVYSKTTWFPGSIHSDKDIEQ